MPMLSMVIFLVFTGFYCLYASSNRTEFQGLLRFERPLKQQKAAARAFGSALLLISLALTISSEGVGAGIFSFMVLLMTLGSLIILLAPLQWLSYRTLLPAFSLIVLFELFLF